MKMAENCLGIVSYFTCPESLLMSTLLEKFSMLRVTTVYTLHKMSIVQYYKYKEKLVILPSLGIIVWKQGFSPTPAGIMVGI